MCGYATFYLSFHQLIGICLFSTLDIMNNTAMKICVQVCMWTCVFISFKFILKVELLGHIVTLSCLTFWGIARLLSSMASSYYIPTRNVWGFQFLQLFTNSCYFLCVFFSNSHPNGCEVVSHCSVDLYFPNYEWCWASFHMLIGHLYMFGELSIWIIDHSLNLVICF